MLWDAFPLHRCYSSTMRSISAAPVGGGHDQWGISRETRTACTLLLPISHVIDQKEEGNAPTPTIILYEPPRPSQPHPTSPTISIKHASPRRSAPAAGKRLPTHRDRVRADLGRTMARRGVHIHAQLLGGDDRLVIRLDAHHRAVQAVAPARPRLL